MLARGERYRHIPGWLLMVTIVGDHIIKLLVLGRDRRITLELATQLVIPFADLIPCILFDFGGL